MKKIEDFEFNDNFFNSYMKTIFGEAFGLYEFCIRRSI